MSQYIGMGQEREIPISISNQRNQTISLVVEVIAWYSASMEDQETIVYFLLFHKIIESPKNTKNPVVNLWSSGSLAQSTLE